MKKYMRAKRVWDLIRRLDERGARLMDLAITAANFHEQRGYARRVALTCFRSRKLADYYDSLAAGEPARRTA